MTRFCAQKHPPITHTPPPPSRTRQLSSWTRSGKSAFWKGMLHAGDPGQPARLPHGNQLGQWKITNNPVVREDYGNGKGKS